MRILVATGGSRRAQLRFVDPRATPVANVLAAEARRGGFDLVVAGSRGRSAVAEWALGSVTRRLLGVSGRPVAVVRAGSRRGGS